MTKIKLAFKVGDSFEYPRKVFFYDTDAAGVLNNCNIFRYFEEARTMFLQSSHAMSLLWTENPHTTVVVAHTEADYKAPAKFNDDLIVQLKVAKIGQTSFQFDYFVTKSVGDSLIAKGNVILVIVDVHTFKPVGIDLGA